MLFSLKRIVVFCVSLLFFLCPPTVFAQEVVFQDDFSNNEPWKIAFNSQTQTPENPCRGPLGESTWEYVNESVQMHIADSVPCKTVITPQGFSAPWPRVSEVHFDMRITSSEMDRNLIFRWQDSDNYLGFHIFGSKIVGEKFVNGNSYAFSSQKTFFEIEPHRTYAIKMRYDESAGTFQLWINTVLVFSGVESSDDPKLTVGQPALGASVGLESSSFVSFDNYQLFDVSTLLSLPVPLYKQSDQTWSNLVYDNASTWSTESSFIGRWGCALTSAVMVLRYHGITHLPNLEPVLPHTLNAWLLSQPDGYVFPGLINWRVLTRLSYWHSGEFGTPALEMKYETTNEHLPWIHSKISLGIAPILDQGGHFIVAHTVGPGSADVGIHDPFYDHETLEAYDNTFQSARVFTPSFTDLRAVSLYVSPGTIVFLLTSHGQEILKPITVFSPRDALEKTESLPLWLYDFSQPEEDFEIEITTALPQDTVQGWVYSKDGEAEPIPKQKIHPQGDVTLEFAVTDETITVAIHNLTHSTFELTPAVVANWLSWRDIRSPVLAQSILELSSSLQNAHHLEEGLSVYENWRAKSQEWLEDKWLSRSVQLFLDEYFYAVLLHKFP